MKSHSQAWRLAVLAAALGLALAGCGEEAYVPAGMVRSPAPDVGTVTLPDVTNGVDWAFRADSGEVLVVYWGYTSCPDVCPTTMADLRTAVGGLGDDAGRVDVAMVTVDPDRDTDAVLTAYVRAFFPDGIAVRSVDPEALSAAAEPFGASYEVTTNQDGLVEVVHTGFLYAVDDRGRVRLTWPFGTQADDIRRDLQALLEEGQDA